jgi:hypothetical protein
MAMLPSAQTPPCERCGLPIVEAHYPDGRCPRPPGRSVRRRVTLCVSGLALITFVVAAIVLPLRSATLISTSLSNGRRIAGPLRPGLQACELFYRWEVTHKTNLLNRALADARSPRVRWQSTLRFRTDLNGLRSWIREEGAARSRGKPGRQNLQNFSSGLWVSSGSYYEYAIQRDCNKFGAFLNSRDWSEFRKDAARGRGAAAHLRQPGN